MNSRQSMCSAFLDLMLAGTERGVTCGLQASWQSWEKNDFFLRYGRIGRRGKLYFAKKHKMTIFVDGNNEIGAEMKAADLDVRAVNTRKNRHHHGYEDLLEATDDLMSWWLSSPKARSG